MIGFEIICKVGMMSIAIHHDLPRDAIGARVQIDCIPTKTEQLERRTPVTASSTRGANRSHELAASNRAGRLSGDKTLRTGRRWRGALTLSAGFFV